MRIIRVPAPTGDPIKDTDNIQKEIDTLYESKEQGVILLESGEYQIGYLLDTRPNSDGAKIRIEDYDIENDFTIDANGEKSYWGQYKYIGLRINGTISSTVALANRFASFFELRGQQRNRNPISKLVKFNMPPIPNIPAPLLTYLNKNYRAMVKGMNGEFGDEINVPALETRLDTLDPFKSLVKNVFQMLIKHFDKTGDNTINWPNHITDTNSFIDYLFEHEGVLTKWEITRARFKFTRPLTIGYTDPDTQSLIANDSHKIRLKYLNFDSNNDIESNRGWESSGNQFEHQAQILVDRQVKTDNLTIDGTGRINFSCQYCDFNNSMGDGLQIHQNVKASLYKLSLTNAARGGISFTAANSKITANHIECIGKPGYFSTFGCEVDNSHYSKVFELKMQNVKAYFIKLNAELAHAKIEGDNLESTHFYNQSGYQSNFKITNSNFYTYPTTGDYGRAMNFHNPGRASYTNCHFICKNSISGEGDNIDRLIYINMQQNGVYLNTSGKVMAKTDGLYQIVENPKEHELYRYGQILSFENCAFKNESNIEIANAFYNVRDYIENYNFNNIDNCQIEGKFSNVFHWHAGRLFVSDSDINIDLKEASEDANKTNLIRVNDLAVLSDISIGNGDSIEQRMPFGTDIMIRDTQFNKNIDYYIYYANMSRRTKLNNINMYIPVHDAKLNLGKKTENADLIELNGGRTISSSHITHANPNMMHLDGLKGDVYEHTNLNGSKTKWKCTQTGDFNVQRPAVWTQELQKLKLKFRKND